MASGTTCATAAGVVYRDRHLRVPLVARANEHRHMILSLVAIYVNRSHASNDAAMNCLRAVWVNSREHTRVNSRER